ncbi:eukaryotic translation initiation factor 2D [Phlebotomus argentipes]|uniref:eukaryotic translation initiation factor 2D n=1 Tax=Phlebotomus argentipes TaxID=94469 RepID=UPI0028931B35|nr:eukaryotic translation initiation factor 2D [Phlebotomus argentipes]
MFIKSFKVKSKLLLRNSERKKLQTKILGKYRKLSEEDFARIFPSSGNIYHTKIITSAEETVWVYLAEKQPMFFEVSSGSIYPTVHALWLVPNLLASVTTHPAVLPILAKGANLMTRGVVKQGQGAQAWARFSRGDVVAVNLTSNANACAVGIFSQSSNDLYLSGGTGVCVEILHVFGDKLWAIEPAACVQIPAGERAVPELKDSDFPALGSKKAPAQPPVAPEAPHEIEEVLEELQEVTIQEEEPESPDDVLKRAFLTALKVDREKLSLPLLSSTFYASHIQTTTPESFNIKHTKHKKVTKFLEQMAEEGFLVLKEEKKGIQKVFSINFDHEELLAFTPGQSSAAKSDADKPIAPKPIQLLTAMTKIFVISDATAPFFAESSHKTGDGLLEEEVDKHLSSYTRTRKLRSAENARLISVDDTLAEILGREVGASMNYSAMLQELLEKMPVNFEMRAKEKQTKLPNIQISLATRKGNKKVTLVGNLEAHGIFIQDFANRCRVGVQASTTVTQTPHAKGDSLLIQGNQVRFVHQLLTDTYGVSKGKISGLELAAKEPKKKK